MKLLFEHFYIAFFIGCIGWVISKDYYCVPAALIAGWVIDIDHLCDYFLHVVRAKKLNLTLIRTGEYFKGNNLVIVPLHSWELSLTIMLSGIFFPMYRAPLIAAGIAHVAHLLQDQWAYRVRFLGYSILSRINQRFAYKGFCRTKHG